MTLEQGGQLNQEQPPATQEKFPPILLAGTGAVPAPAGEAPVPATRPEYVAETFWDTEKGAVKEKEFGAHLAGLEEFKAARKGLESPDAYKVEVPKDAGLPEGFEFDLKDPRLASLRKLAHDDGWSQKTFDSVLGLEAARTKQWEMMVADSKAFLAKELGDTGAERISALHTFFESFCKTPEQAAIMKNTLWQPVVVEAFETLQRLATSQGIVSIKESGREAPPKDGKPDGFNEWPHIDQIQWDIDKRLGRAAQ